MAIVKGTYAAKAYGEVVLGASAQKGTPFLEFYFQITEGENKGGKVRYTAYFTENTNERSIQSLQTCGWTGEDLSEFADGALHGLDANAVDIVVDLEEYQDKQGENRLSPRVQWVNRSGGYLNRQSAMDPGAAKAFGDRMRGLVLNLKNKQPQKGIDTDFPHGANVPSGVGKSF